MEEPLNESRTMQETFPPSPAEPARDSESAHGLDPHAEAERRRREAILSRLRLLLLLGVGAFVLATWMLVRVDDPGRFLPFASGPSRVVRSHLEALNRGEFRAAYNLFSPAYRGAVTFEIYHQLVVTHVRMFRTRLVALKSRESSVDRAVLDTRLLGADGERYIARFTLVRADGQWWIDDVRWSSEADQRRNLIAV